MNTLLFVILATCSMQEPSNKKAELDVTLSLPNSYEEGETITCDVRLKNQTDKIMCYGAVRLEGVRARPSSGIGEICDESVPTGPEAVGAMPIPTGYSAATVILPGKEVPCTIRMKAFEGGSASVRVQYAFLERKEMFVQKGGGIPNTRSSFRPLGEKDSIGSEVAIRSPEKNDPMWKSAQHSFSVSPTPRPYSAADARKDAKLDAKHLTFFTPAHSWVLSDGHKTAFIDEGQPPPVGERPPGPVRTVDGDFVEAFENLDLEGGSNVEIGGELDPKENAGDKKFWDFLTTVMGKEPEHKFPMAYGTFPVSRLVDMVCEAQKCGLKFDRSPCWWSRD